jgi:hypothetical protein
MGKQYSASQTMLSPRRRTYENHARDSLGYVRESNESPRSMIRQLLKDPEDLDVMGLGSKICEILRIRSGDRIEVHVLADGSVRVINYRNR